jgi:hypothetical protein
LVPQGNREPGRLFNWVQWDDRTWLTQRNRASVIGLILCRFIGLGFLFRLDDSFIDRLRCWSRSLLRFWLRLCRRKAISVNAGREKNTETYF